MPEVSIHVGGRDFEVACQDGEEDFLQTAAKMLDDEAQVLLDQVGRLPEGRMLLMAGLMLADKAASFEDHAKGLQLQLDQALADLDALRNAPPPEPERVEVPVMPEGLEAAMEAMATQAEAVAASVAAKLAP